VDKDMEARAVARGEVLVLTQRSVRRREYELGRGDEVAGWLRFPPGRRSVAAAWTEATGSLWLTAGAGGVEVRGDPDGAALLATVEQGAGRAAVIRLAGGSGLRWRRTGRWHRWVVDDHGAALLGVTAAHRLLKASVLVTVQQPIPEPAAVLLSLVAGFLALRSLQTEVDASAAIGGIVASGAG
jgi:hypothetical protein